MWYKTRRWYNREYRNKPTWEAYKLGELLKERGWRVDYEKFDGYKHIDIAIVECRVNIEMDGNQHFYNSKQAFADLERNYYSFEKGFVTLHVPNTLMKDSKRVELTVKFVDKFLQISKSRN